MYVRSARTIPNGSSALCARSGVPSLGSNGPCGSPATSDAEADSAPDAGADSASDADAESAPDADAESAAANSASRMGPKSRPVRVVTSRSERMERGKKRKRSD
eukprot:2423608-Pleurochrysis_carterae.AAC.1